MSTATFQPPFPWYLRLFILLSGKRPDQQPAPAMNDGTPDALIGRAGQVLSEIRPGYYRGKISIGSHIYSACCRLDSNPLYEGEWVQIVGVKLGRLVVERIPFVQH